MRRALLVLALVLLVVAGLVVANAALSSQLEGELDHLDVSEAGMAARHHPPGSVCVRYPAVEPELPALRETADRLVGLGLAVDDWADLFGHLVTLEQRREQALHGHSMAEEYLAELERSTEGRPLARLAFSLQRSRLLEKLEGLTSIRDMAATGQAAFAKLSAPQQAGVLALLAERPTHFQLGAFVRLLQDARDRQEQGRVEAQLPEPEPEPADPCPALPHRASIARAELVAMLDGERGAIGQVRVVPAFANGTFEGFKLFGLRRASRVAAVGFCNGDRVLTLNGRELSSPAAVLDGVAEWRQAKTLEFALVRDGEKGTLTLEVLDAAK